MCTVNRTNIFTTRIYRKIELGNYRLRIKAAEKQKRSTVSRLFQKLNKKKTNSLVFRQSKHKNIQNYLKSNVTKVI